MGLRERIGRSGYGRKEFTRRRVIEKKRPRRENYGPTPERSTPLFAFRRGPTAIIIAENAPKEYAGRDGGSNRRFRGRYRTRI